jgi:hypothetical protein
MKNRILYAASFVAVLLIFQLSYGLQILVPTNISWMMTALHDWGTHYLGWLYYKNEPWQFPFGGVANYFYPIGTNIGLTDSIPLFAIFFKLFAGILPDNFQYFGIWLFSCHLLAAYFTVRLFLLLKVNHIITFIAVILIAANPVLIHRGMHPALCAHWLVIASIYLYCLDPKIVTVKKILRYQLVFLILSALINPYMCLMVFGFTVTLSARLGFFDKIISKKYFFAYNATSIIILLLTWYLVGVLSFNSGENLSVEGSYGLYSLNLNSLYNSSGWSNYLPGLKQVSWHQYEGFMYLGLGILLLLVLLLLYFSYSFLAKLIWKTPQKFPSQLNKKWLIPLVTMVTVFTLFAITHVVSVNDHVLFRVPLPHIFVKLGETFRASGRFFWIPYYLIIFFAIIAIARIRIHIVTKISILTIILFIQLKDTWHLITMYNLSYGAYNTPLDNNNWESLIKEYKEIALYPPFEGTYLTKLDYQYFCFLAAKDAKPINTGYVARANYKSMDKYRDSLESNIQNGNLSPSTLYITTAANLNYFSPSLQSSDWGISMLDNYYFIYDRSTKNKKLLSLINTLNQKNKERLDSVNTILNRKTLFTETSAPVNNGKDSIQYFIEKFNVGEKYISIGGWGFVNNTDNNKGDSVFITLTNDNISYIAPTSLQDRPDITSHFKKSYLNDAGFKTIAFFDNLQKGDYQFGIVIKNIRGEFIHQLTDRIVKIGLKENAEPKKITLPPPTGKIIYNFDLFENNTSHIRLGGWATIENHSTEGQSINFVFKNEKDIYKFETEPVKRPDVTAFFKNKYNLDNSGFSVKVLKNAFNKGKYQIGIIIKDQSNKEVFMLTDKVIEIQ